MLANFVRIKLYLASRASLGVSWNFTLAETGAAFSFWSSLRVCSARSTPRPTGTSEVCRNRVSFFLKSILRWGWEGDTSGTAHRVVLLLRSVVEAAVFLAREGREVCSRIAGAPLAARASRPSTSARTRWLCWSFNFWYYSRICAYLSSIIYE